MPVEAPFTAPKREFPYCTVCLVTLTLACHALVLAGNVYVSETFNSIGLSTGGWSDVGRGLGRSLEGELDVLMKNVSDDLVEAINQSAFIQQSMDLVLSLAGTAADKAVTAGTKASMAALLIQTNADPGSSLGNLPTVLQNSINGMLENTMDQVMKQINKLMEALKPALEQVGKWILQFGDKLQDMVESFSTTIDKVQAILNKIMSQVAASGAGFQQMVYDTFTLFDASGTGVVTQQDLEDVAKIYSVQALQGSKPEELLDKYDVDGDKAIDKKEFALLVLDESIPNIMANVLRNYARRLSEIAGNVGAAKMRGEVSLAVVQYFQIVCAKNLTKVYWVSERLTNSSVPLAFTADILAQMALSVDSPEKLTTADVGELVVGAMYDMNPQTTVDAVKLMSESEYWVEEGFVADDQPVCVERVTDWLVHAKKHGGPLAQQMGGSDHDVSLLDIHKAVVGDTSVARFNENSAELMSTQARLAAQQRMSSYLDQRHKAKIANLNELYSTTAAQMLRMHLLGGKPAQGASHSPTAAERAVKSGIPAADETLEFARFLSWNASDTADRFQKQCMDFSSESSNAIDSFATQMKAMVKKVNGFVKMMMEYATPAGIDRLEKQVQDFVENAAEDVLDTLEDKIDGIVEHTAPLLDNSVQDAIDEAGEKVGDFVGNLLGDLISKTLATPAGDAIGKVINNTEAGDIIGDMIGPFLADDFGNKTAAVLHDEVSQKLRELLDKAVSASTDALENLQPRSLLQTDAKLSVESVSRALQTSKKQVAKAYKSQLAARKTRRVGQKRDGFGDSFSNMASVLQSMLHSVPNAEETLKFARTEVSKFANNLNSVFNTLGDRGPTIFTTVAQLYKTIWVMYFVLIAILTSAVLFYGLWASGYFGGPQAADSDAVDVPPPQGFREKMRVVVLLLFLVSIVLAIVAGVQSLIITGCAQVYVLGDDEICQNTVKSLTSFVESFYIGDVTASLEAACEHNHLLTCHMVEQKMQAAIFLTTVFSLLAAVVSLQMLVDSAILHERAKYMRIIDKMEKQEKSS